LLANSISAKSLSSCRRTILRARVALGVEEDPVVTAVGVGGATTYIASGEIEVPPFALES
jgi:hypothetical protein